MGTLTEAFARVNAVKTTSDTPKGEKVTILYYTKLVQSPYQYRDKSKTAEQKRKEILSLAADIEADKGIIQPLIVRKIDTDVYEIVAGHNRWEAIIYLVEEKGLTEYAFVPCIVKKLTDAQAEYMTTSSNNQRAKTDWEIMHELETKKRILEEHPEDYPHLKDIGAMIDKLVVECGMKRSTVGEYLQISNSLSDRGKEAFQAGEIKKSAAVALAGLPEAEQDALIDAGVTQHKDVKAYKEEKIKKTTHRTTITDTEKTVTIHSGDAMTRSIVEPAEVIDVLPGQFKVINTDMELKEEQVSDDTNTDAKFSICDEIISDIKDLPHTLGERGAYVCLLDVLDIVDSYRVYLK